MNKAKKKRATKKLKDRQAFREAVLKRSGGFCDRCRKRYGVLLHAHHYRPRSLGGPHNNDPRLPAGLFPIEGQRVARRGGPYPPDDVHEDGNGVALCGRCHLDVHMRRGEAARWIDSHNRALDAQKGTRFSV